MNILYMLIGLHYALVKKIKSFLQLQLYVMLSTKIFVVKKRYKSTMHVVPSVKQRCVCVTGHCWMGGDWMHAAYCLLQERQKGWWKGRQTLDNELARLTLRHKIAIVTKYTAILYDAIQIDRTRITKSDNILIRELYADIRCTRSIIISFIRIVVYLAR